MSAAVGTRRTLRSDEYDACMVVWGVVNVVCLLQAIGFATRSFAPGVDAILGLGIAAAALPAAYALIVFARAHSGWRLLIGPLVFDVFVVLMLAVDYVLRIEWRDPVRPLIQIPYLALFFGGILFMGLPMFRIDRRRWGMTVGSTTLLIAAMLYAMWQGVG